MVRWPRVSQLTFGQVLKVSRLTLGSHTPTVGMKQSPGLGSEDISCHATAFVHIQIWLGGIFALCNTALRPLFRAFEI